MGMEGMAGGMGVDNMTDDAREWKGRSSKNL